MKKRNEENGRNSDAFSFNRMELLIMDKCGPHLALLKELPYPRRDAASVRPTAANWDPPLHRPIATQDEAEIELFDNFSSALTTGHRSDWACFGAGFGAVDDSRQSDDNSSNGGKASTVGFVKSALALVPVGTSYRSFPWLSNSTGTVPRKPADDESEL
ncbi:hypothetical protein T12_11928 [Trichinella patagoniensis]|uniref:Uncharacterized protein n=1 Tax=Trichinella patagoniensis TaxID=990121 RepID=A0A0V0ZBK3_9BILA|nr:hypothetical protein T12_11928 [Trichinella patagoniensis]